MAALQYVDVPGYAALLIRRNFADLALPNALMDRAHSWLDKLPNVHWNEARKQFKFPCGATLTFGYLEGGRDADRYASAEFHMIGVDEVTQFSEQQYLDLFARLRAPACRSCNFETGIPTSSRKSRAADDELLLVHRVGGAKASG